MAPAGQGLPECVCGTLTMSPENRTPRARAWPVPAPQHSLGWLHAPWPFLLTRSHRSSWLCLSTLESEEVTASLTIQANVLSCTLGPRGSLSLHSLDFLLVNLPSLRLSPVSTNQFPVSWTYLQQAPCIGSGSSGLISVSMVSRVHLHGCPWQEFLI